MQVSAATIIRLEPLMVQGKSMAEDVLGFALLFIIIVIIISRLFEKKS